MSGTARAYVVADVFTDVALAGNPVAVFTAAEGLSAAIMQRLARELNLSETVFLFGDETGGADARARIFTPAVELPFAGHPLLGTAFVVGERSGADAVRLLTGAGIVPIVLRREGGAIVFGEMTQPVPTWALYDRPDTLLEALGVPGSELPIEVYDNGPRHVLVMAGDERVVAGLRPDLGALAALGPLGVSCFAERVAGAAAGGASPGARRFTTRMFAPGLGVAEDPATGSAAGPLAVHLARHRRIAYGERIEISQGAQIGRPSTLHAVVEGSEERIERVAVGGGAVIVARGEFIVG